MQEGTDRGALARELHQHGLTTIRSEAGWRLIEAGRPSGSRHAPVAIRQRARRVARRRGPSSLIASQAPVTVLLGAGRYESPEFALSSRMGALLVFE